MSKRPVRIANIAGFFGDRPTAMREQLRGGAIDVLTGDYLAELTMLILARTRARRPDGGFARTFVRELEEVLGEVMDNGVKVVVNAGGLDPAGCAAAVREVATKLGLSPVVAAISGDDLMGRLQDLQAQGERFTNLQTGEDLGALAGAMVTANAYLGGWGIMRALEEGADIVVTGRVADAVLVSGPAAWWHEWGRYDYDRLAGAIVAGHVVECGLQATGGNYSFFTEVPSLEYPGFPWAEIADDGSCVLGKHEGTGGEVSVGTVVSQLLYEIGPPAYVTPDVVARFDTIQIEQEGPDRVRIHGVRGESPPQSLKVAAATVGGFRNSMMVGLTGLNAEAKAQLLSQQVWRALPWEPDDYDEVTETVIGRGEEDPVSNAAATSFWQLAVRSTDEEKVGRDFSNAAVHVALGSIPGMFGLSPPGPATPFARYWPTTVDRKHITQMIDMGGPSEPVPETEPSYSTAVDTLFVPIPEPPRGPTRRAPLGTIVGTRSGDKGGAANLGVFARSGPAYAWIEAMLTVERLRELIPETAELAIDRYSLPNLWALNFVIHGLLGEGVSSSLRVDPQAKGLGEYLRARHADIPVALLEEAY